MKCKTNGRKLFDYRTKLGKYKIGAFLGQFCWEDNELESLISLCQKIWKEVYIKAGSPDFMGLVRPDLVPVFSDPMESSLGRLGIGGIYEINTHSPECLAGISALEEATGQKTVNDPCVIFANKIRDIFGKDEITFVCGDNLLKREWGDLFFKKLRRIGLNLQRMSSDEVMRENPKLIFRWGDVRIDGPSHFDQKFIEWLKIQKKSTVFNTIPNGVDLGDKSHLLSSDDMGLACIFGENRLLTSEEDVWWSVDENDRHSSFLVKPNKGASGNDISFGEQMTVTRWIETLRENLGKGGYSIWQAKWLPKICVDGQELSMDLDPVFWAHGNELEYMYTIVRVDNSGSYQERKTINVAQGAGLAIHTVN
jgi:hypothetical protein